MERKNKPIKWPLLVLLCLLPLTTAIALLLDQAWLYYVTPFGFLELFLLSWFDARWLLLALSLLPLVGWWLMHRGIRQGKWIVNAILAALLAADVLIFLLHFITTLGVKNSGMLSVTVLLAIACPVLCIPALVMTNKWYPNI